MLIQYFLEKLMKAALAAAVAGQAISADLPEPPAVTDLSASAISVGCIKAEWNAEEGKDYELSITPTDENTGYTDNICIKFEGKSKSYITGLREGSEYEIVVKELDPEGKPIDSSAASELCTTEKVEVIWDDYEYQDGWTQCFAGERVSGLTAQPSWGAIQGAVVDPITNTGIMRDEYGDYCVAMGVYYGYCWDRFLIELDNGIQFTVKICDSKGWADDGEGKYHWFGGEGNGKCIIEFIYDEASLPSCVAFSGSWGYYNWNGLNFDNIRSIKKINYGEKVEY